MLSGNRVTESVDYTLDERPALVALTSPREMQRTTDEERASERGKREREEEEGQREEGQLDNRRERFLSASDQGASNKKWFTIVADVRTRLAPAFHVAALYNATRYG